MPALADVVVTPRFGPADWRDFQLADLFLAAGRAAALEQLPALQALSTPVDLDACAPRDGVLAAVSYERMDRQRDAGEGLRHHRARGDRRAREPRGRLRRPLVRRAGRPGRPAARATGASSAAAAAATGQLAPVLVTFLKDVDALREALEGSRVHWVQLHGYQTPGLVRAVKGIAPDVRVLKVLHVRGGECVEEPLIGSYEKAGVDVFLFDAVTEDGRVGSTGQTLDAAARRLARRQARRGRSCSPAASRPTTASEYAALDRHPRFLGIDVDTNARGADGKVSARAGRGDLPRPGSEPPGRRDRA